MKWCKIIPPVPLIPHRYLVPTIYDNIENRLSSGLNQVLGGSEKADFCVGYFNLRGWGQIADSVDHLNGGEGSQCRLLIGMARLEREDLLSHLLNGNEEDISNREIDERVQRARDDFRTQLGVGIQSIKDEKSLRKLKDQLLNKKLVAKLFTGSALHAKLYLVHRRDNTVPLVGFVGSSNLTLPGLHKNKELNIDVVEQDAAKKLSQWFEKQWEHKHSIDVTDYIVDLIEESWAGKERSPYLVYVKTAWHLSKEFIKEEQLHQLPREIDKELLPHQKKAVTLASQRLNERDGVIVSDVVGLGKTKVAAAIARNLFHYRRYSTLVVCPPALEDMWRNQLNEYKIQSDVISHGKLKQLSDKNGFALIIVDESHNFRNRDGKKHELLKEYILANDCKVILLSATPYNKSFQDIASQLLLFVNPDDDLGVKPEKHIKNVGGEFTFQQRHQDINISSLAAFEKSEVIDDWRELMTLFMVRRTRSHIQKYATKENGRYFLTFANGEKFYFPKRTPKKMDFAMKSEDIGDQYARLYSDDVVDRISQLTFARFGLQNYRTEVSPVDVDDKKALEDITRSGNRLRGFIRVGLFKRLESSGKVFIESIKRHAIKNMMMAHAYEEGGKVPIGSFQPDDYDETGDLLERVMEEEEAEEDIVQLEDANYSQENHKYYENEARKLFENLMDRNPKGVRWLSSKYFNSDLVTDLKQDANSFINIIKLVAGWDETKDRKLAALKELVLQQHKDEKVLIFTQYKDTAIYLNRALAKEDKATAVIHAGLKSSEVAAAVNKFSPESNKASDISQLRILVSTDKLSEGVNLQDCRIVVNYDLPWAVIRLIQRIGRVDRLGQKAGEILYYYALPEEGIDKIIRLRTRLKNRINENKELIGSDEKLFEYEEGLSKEELVSLYNEDQSLEEPEDDETDLISKAYDIWEDAIKKDPGLDKVISHLPNAIYSTKKSEPEGVIAYIRNSRGQQILAEVSKEGEIISQSQNHILNRMECTASEKPVKRLENHYELVARAYSHLNNEERVGGQLGSKKSPRHVVYRALQDVLQEDVLLTSEISNDYKQAAELVHQYSLTSGASNALKREIKNKLHGKELAKMAITLYKKGILCRQRPSERERIQIICSLGLNK